MLTDPDKPIPAIVPIQPNVVHAIKNTSFPKGFKSVESDSGDIESHHELAEVESDDLDLNFYRLINEVWHFCSVDWGAGCKFLESLLN